MTQPLSRKKSLSIGTKMLAFCLLMLIIPVATMGFIGYTVAKEETDGLIEKDLQHSVRLAVEMAGLLEQSVKENQLSVDEAKERLKEMLLGQRNADGTRNINKEIDLGENGYFFVLDSKGTLIAHPAMEDENIWDRQSSDGVYYIQDIISKGQNGGGFTYYEWPLPDSTDEALKVSYSEITNDWGWIIAAGSYYQDYNSGQVRIFNSIWITLLVCIVVGGVLVYFFSRSISHPIKKLTTYSEEVANGNLQIEPMKIHRSDEIGQLTEHFNVMVGNLRGLVGEALQTSENVRELSDKLSQSLAETTDATQHIAESIEELSEGTDTQSKSTEESVRVMEEMNDGIQQIAEISTMAFETAGDMSQQSQKGNEMIQDSVKSIESVQGSFHGLVTTIQQLVENSANIEEINSSINDIANQTHLLALNASIEAARAGEHGSGFAVVAQEVRKLADESADSSRHISNLVGELKKSIVNVEKVIQLSQTEIDSSVSLIHETGNVFRDILTASRLVVEKVEDASATAQQMSAGSEEVTASIQEIARISADTSGRAEEITAATEQQYATIQDINVWARELNDQVIRLKEQVAKFRV